MFESLGASSIVTKRGIPDEFGGDAMDFGVQFKRGSQSNAAAANGAAHAVCRTLAAALLAAGLAATPAMAGDFPELSPSLTYQVSGIVTPKCELTTINPSVDIDGLANPADNTTAAIDVALQFDVACNAPVRVAMASRHGGLKFQGSGTSDSAFADLVAYRASVDLPGHQNVLSCTSERMADGRKACEGESDGAVGAGKGAIQLRVAAGQGLLLAGKYSDQVTIVIAPRLGGEDEGAGAP